MTIVIVIVMVRMMAHGTEYSYTGIPTHSQAPCTHMYTDWGIFFIDVVTLLLVARVVNRES